MILSTQLDGRGLLLTPTEARIKPEYCHYAKGGCDQSFEDALHSDKFFVFPSEPKPISDALLSASRNAPGESRWKSWKDLDIGGRLVFCTICKAIRHTSCLVADVTTLNQNVLFEIGYAMGLGMPVIPVRDSSYVKDGRLFEQLGLFETLGYLDFDTSRSLAKSLASEPIPKSITPVNHQISSVTPIYMLLPERSTDGSAAFASAIKKSRLGGRSFIREEVPRLSLHEADKQVGSSLGFFAYLLDPNRSEATLHNAISAFLAGMALARGQVVAMVQENSKTSLPIDYRDLIRRHDTASEVAPLLYESITQMAINTAAIRQEGRRISSLPEKLIERVDLGDLAAENEITRLPEYFVPTGQSALAHKGHARLVVGRKGSGKTAIFYSAREHAWRTKRSVVLDLKPESHQFARLRDFVRDEMPEGLALHTMVAFWNYLLLTELARRILHVDRVTAARDPQTFELYSELDRVYSGHNPGVNVDFSQRLHFLVARLLKQFETHSLSDIGQHLTELVFRGDMRELRRAVGEYLAHNKDSVWVLVDNLDKGLPTRGATQEDVLIVRGLLDSTRKLQRQVEDLEVDYHCLVFLRNDIYEQLLQEISDKGKDTAISLDWDDPELFEEIVRRRVVSSTELSSANFRQDVWPNLCETHVGVVDSFDWILERTLLRPRDLLFFLREAIAVAINRNHRLIQQDDLLHAEARYSEDQLLMLSFELQQIAPELGDLVFAFQGRNVLLGTSDLEDILSSGTIDQSGHKRAVELLVWYGFLGVHSDRTSTDSYSHQVGYSLRRLMQPLTSSEGRYVVHPMFRRALGLVEPF